jgi:hypothetical protein
MNERIKQLASKANFGSIEKNNNDVQYDVRLSAFAELIVRECVTVMYDDAIERKVPPDINQTPTHYAVAVLKHFGVE